jgi:glycine/D-amino acid oxidase-like deaminating enzyme
MTAHLRATIDEVGRVAAAEGIDCSFTKAGTIVFARSPSQVTRAHAQVEHARSWGDTEEDLRFLDSAETGDRARAAGALGATYTPHCARIHPARLVRGLANAVERRGVALYEQTAATAITSRRVKTARGDVTAAVVVRATEGYTPELPGHRRDVSGRYLTTVDKSASQRRPSTNAVTDSRADVIAVASLEGLRYVGEETFVGHGQRSGAGGSEEPVYTLLAFEKKR